MLVTPGQIKAARAMLDWSAEELGKRVGVVKTTISAIETGRSNGSVEVLNAIVGALQAGGIEFQADGGIKPRANTIKVLEGKDGFWSFYTDVYETIRSQGGDVLVSNVDESQFSKWLGDRIGEHRQRMYPLKNYDLRILLQEGDMNFLSKYERCEYRWIPKTSFSDVPFYIYGDKVALINFDTDGVTIFIHEHSKITNMFRTLFAVNWNNAIIPPYDKEVK